MTDIFDQIAPQYEASAKPAPTPVSTITPTAETAPTPPTRDIFDVIQRVTTYEPSKEENDLAYNAYVASVPGETSQVMLKDYFVKSGEAKKWIVSGAVAKSRDFPGKVVESFSRGGSDFNLDRSYFKAVILGEGDSETLYQQHLKSQAVNKLDPIQGANLVQDSVLGLGGVIPGMKIAAEQSVPLIAVGVGAGVIAGVQTTAGGSVLGPAGTLVGAGVGVGAIVSGAALGFKLGSTYTFYEQGAGQFMLQMRDLGFDNTSGKIIASVAGVPYALSENIQLAHAIPGLREGANTIIKSSMNRVLGEVAKRYGANIGTQVGQEVIQEAIGIFAEDLASYYEGKGIRVSKADLVAQGSRLWETAKQTTVAVALLPSAEATVNLVSGRANLRLRDEFVNLGYRPEMALSVVEGIRAGLTTGEAHFEAVAKRAIQIHEASGGSTIDYRTGESVTDGYPIGLGLGEQIAGKTLTAEQYKAYFEKHRNVLAQPGNHVGTWYDGSDNTSWLDVVQVPATIEEATTIGKSVGEKALYNLKTGETVTLDYTKEADTNLKDGPYQHPNGTTAILKVSEDGGTVKVSDVVTPPGADKTTAEKQFEATLARYADTKNMVLDAEGKIRLPESTLPGKVDAEAQVKSVQAVEPKTADHAIGQQYGLTPAETDQRLTKAEERFRTLKSMDPDKRSKSHNKELAFLRRNRDNIEQLLTWDTDPTNVRRKVSDKKETMMQINRLADVLGYDELERRDNYEIVTNSRSLREMTDTQRHTVLDAFRKDAQDKGINTDELAKVNPVRELLDRTDNLKQNPKLGDLALRDLSLARKITYDIKRGLTWYFLNSSRIRRFCRALDGYTNGPFSKIFKTVKDADMRSNVNFTVEMGRQISRFNDMGIDVPGMFTEVKDLGIKPKLNTAERVGIYALAQNDKTLRHLKSEFSDAEIKIISDSVKDNDKELAVVDEIKSYFEQSWPLLEAVAQSTGYKKLVKEHNYMAAFITDKENIEHDDFMEGLVSDFAPPGVDVPGAKHLKKRVGGARHIETNIFVIYARAAKSLERFKAMAPTAKQVGTLLNNRNVKEAINNVTYGQGSKLMSNWLIDSVRGYSPVDGSALAPAFRWLRRNSINYVLGFKVISALKQGISILNAAQVDPAMVPAILSNLHKAFTIGKYNEMLDVINSKTDLVRERAFDRDLRTTWNDKMVQKAYTGKSLSPLSMRMLTEIDKRTVAVSWWSAYQVAQGKGMNEADSVSFADGVISDTQPMGKAADLPSFFRGNELEKNLTIFQNQINQNGNSLWYDVIGARKAGAISNTDVVYRLLMGQVAPAMLLGLISRGRLPKDPEEIAKDLAFYLMTPYLFAGRWAYNLAAGGWGQANQNIIETPFVAATNLARTVRSMAAGGKTERRFYPAPTSGKNHSKLADLIKYGAQTTGAFSGGRIPLQALQTVEGGWDIITGDDPDWRRLIWSRYSLQGKEKKNGKEVKRTFRP